MSKATEEFKKLMESDRGEPDEYRAANPDYNIRVPITRAGFEALLEVSCAYMSLPVTNPLRNVLVGFLHHIENDTCVTTISAIGAALHKSMSNQCTWEIDQEVKDAANAELREEQDKQRAALEEIERLKKIEAAQEKRQAKAAKRNGKQPLPVVTTTTTASNEKTQ